MEKEKKIYISRVRFIDVKYKGETERKNCMLRSIERKRTHFIYFQNLILRKHHCNRNNHIIHKKTIKRNNDK